MLFSMYNRQQLRTQDGTKTDVMAVWVIMLSVILLGLIAIIVMTLTKTNMMLLYIIAIVMALFLLLIELIYIHKPTYEQGWILPTCIIVTSIVVIILGIAALTNGGGSEKRERRVNIGAMDNDRPSSRPPRTGHRASRAGRRVRR